MNSIISTVNKSYNATTNACDAFESNLRINFERSSKLNDQHLPAMVCFGNPWMTGGFGGGGGR